MNRKLKVLWIVSWYTEQNQKKMSAGIFHHEQAEALSKYCDIAIYYPFDQNLKKRFSNETEWGIKTYRSKVYHSENKLIIKLCILYNYIKLFADFLRIKREFHPDILHANVALGVGKFSVILSRIFRIPLIVTEHLPLEMAHYLDNKKNYMRGKFVYQNSQYNICVSRDLTKKLGTVFKGIPFHTIFNGIHIMDYGKAQVSYRREGLVNIVIVGGFYDKYVKGYQYLLPAVANLKRKGLRFVLHIIGGGTYLKHYQNMAAELELKDVCIFYGSKNHADVLSLIEQMDFFVSSSIVESAGIAVMEAMMLGIPVLGTTSGGVESLLPDFAGIIVPSESVGDLEDGIQKMIKYKDAYDRKRIRDYAAEKFDIDQISKKYMRVYEKVIR